MNQPQINLGLTMDTDLFRNVVPFVSVLEHGSFRAAAQRLGVSPAAVSKAVKALEAELGTSLLNRSARAVTATREGEMFFERCQQAVAAVSGARQNLAASRKVPSGELSVSVPYLAVSLLAPAMALLRARHPRVSFRVTVTDRLSRLVEESIDIAVRVGPLRDSSLVARHLKSTRIVTVASPGYVSVRGLPRDPDALASHDCLVALSPGGKPRPWLFARGPVEVPATLIVDHGPTLLDAALAGVGVAQVLDYMAAPHLSVGRLVAVCAHEDTDGPDIHAVCAPGQRASARVRAAFDAFADAFKGATG